MKDMEKHLKADALKDPMLALPEPNGINDFIKKSQESFSQESIQKTFLVTMATITIPGLTWLLISSPGWPVGTKTNIFTIIYVCCLYVFFQFYDTIVRWFVGSILKWKIGASFVLEFLKFFLTFFTTMQYSQEWVLRPVFEVRQHPSLIFVTISSVIYASVSAMIFYRFRKMKEMTLKSKVAQAEAQYSLLESQMQPHFLFNSLNVLSELIYVDPDMATAMTQKLADLYREILHNSKAKFSTLESEISILQKYIEIQKIRFGERIHFNADVSPAFYNLQIPSLMLQTLVENAIKHGISPKKEGGEIDLSVKRDGKFFEVCISNTGNLYKGHQVSKRSTGLQNTINRLDITYGNKHQFEIFSDGKRTYVKFRITGRSQ
ncbi:MAG: histidine kinase [Bdellovibrionales bacterium]|nr:histidine kinase [Bdellovibrionales bacterium]